MKNLTSFTRFINESISINPPDGVIEIDAETYTRLERENLGEPFTEGEKKKLDGVRQFLKLQRYPGKDDSEFVMVGKWNLNAAGHPAYSLPAAWFRKMSPGTYTMVAIFDDVRTGNFRTYRPTKRYTSESLDKLIPCVVDLIDAKFGWIKTK